MCRALYSAAVKISTARPVAALCLLASPVIQMQGVTALCHYDFEIQMLAVAVRVPDTWMPRLLADKALPKACSCNDMQVIRQVSYERIE